MSMVIVPETHISEAYFAAWAIRDGTERDWQSSTQLGRKISEEGQGHAHDGRVFLDELMGSET